MNTTNEATGSVQLVVLDIDGVVTEGESSALDLQFLSTLAAHNQHARAETSLAPITLCTGRPAPYLELMLQAIDCRLPGVFENGAGLYFPDTYRFTAHPLLQNDGVMRQVRDRLERGPIEEGHAYFQPGKIYTLTVFATDPGQTDQLDAWAREALGDLTEQVQLVYSTSCLNILPRSIDKGKGIENLAHHSGYPPEGMLGVGDSDVDLPFLQKIGMSAAPSNAVEAVKQIVNYVSAARTSAGVSDILKHYGVLR